MACSHAHDELEDNLTYKLDTAISSMRAALHTSMRYYAHTSADSVSQGSASTGLTGLPRARSSIITSAALQQCHIRIRVCP